MGSVLWRALRKNRTLRYGAPMLLLIIGGSFGLREFTQIRYDAQKMQRKIDPALEGIIKKNKVTLESEFEVAERDKKNKKFKETNFDEWKNIRGPRPWEDSKSFQDEQRGSTISKET